ncbi:MAG TPA: hypothetical protein VGM92_00010 [Candidatus Kapabacteria bacterium]|jgi:hypothetical protein
MFDLTPAHLHLLVNHLPVEGSIAAFLLLLWALLRRSSELKRLALLAFIFVGICTFVADQTGGGASREMRNVSGIDIAKIHEHSQSADYAQMIAFGVAVVSLIGLIIAWQKSDTPIVSHDRAEYIRHHKEPPKWVMIVVLIAGLLEMSVFARTAYLGGLIRHPEIQSSFPVPADTSKHSQPL